jgi:hypothetical protein
MASLFTSARATAGRDPRALRAAIDDTVAEGAGSILMLNALQPDGLAALRRVIRWSPVPVFGGVFPSVIFGTDVLEVGHVVLGLASRARIGLVQGLSDVEFAAEAAVAAAVDATDPHGTTFLFVAGGAQRIEGVLRSVYDHLGADRCYLGGGCGVLDDLDRPSVVSPEGIHRDALVVASVREPSSVAVALGWRPVAGPFTVTASAGTLVRELDFAPASDVFHEHLRRRDDGRAGPAPARALGVSSLTGELVVRDVIGASDTGLSCVGEVPSFGRVYLLEGDAPQLVAAAAEGARSLESVPGPRLVLDCVSRVGVLGSSVIDELRALRGATGAASTAGAWTVGEIAGGQGQPIAFLNKSLVVAGAAGRRT